MKSHHDKELKSVISYLKELADSGTLEQGQKEAISEAIKNLRRASRTRDPDKILAAVSHVARIFLRVSGR